MEFGGMQIAALSELLQTQDEDSDSDGDQPCSGLAKLNPGSIGPMKTADTNTKADDEKRNSKDIWAEDEVAEGSEYADVDDPRAQPEYDIIYKQAVTSEDMFLGMANKTPSTASCEEMIVKVRLPGAKMSDVQLDVKTKFLDIRSSKFKLGLHLPHPVDHKSGRAQWDGKKEELSVTLKMMREYDFMNF